MPEIKDKIRREAREKAKRLKKQNFDEFENLAH